MTASIVPVLGLSAREIDAWGRLAAGAVEPNPFFDPGYILPAAAHLERGRQAHLAFVEEGGEMVAAVPLRRLFGAGRLKVVTSRAFQVVNLGTPLLAAGAPDGAAGDLLALVARASGAGVLALEWLGADGPVAAAVRRAAGELGMPWRTYKTWARPVIRRGEVPACAQPSCELCERCLLLTTKRSRGLRRWRRGLAQQLGPPAMVDETGDPGWPDRFLAMEAAGWKGRLATGSGALAQRPGYGAWFRESTMALARSGTARFFSLKAGDDVVAMFYLVATPGGGAFACNMCYREDMRPYAPGVQLLLGTVRFFFQGTDSTFYDACTVPENSHFTEFFTSTRQMTNLAIAVDGRPGRAAVAALGVSAPALRNVKRVLEKAVPVWTVP